MFLQKKITEIKLRANASTDKSEQIRASQEIIQRALLCGANDLDVYTALKLLEQEKLLTNLAYDAKDEEVIGMSWYLPDFKLFDRPVLQINYFYRFNLDNSFGMTTDLAVQLKVGMNDPTALIEKFDIPANPVPDPYLKENPRNRHEVRIRHANGDAVWASERSKFQGFRDISNYSKPPQMRPLGQKELYTVPSLSVSCERTTSVFPSNR